MKKISLFSIILMMSLCGLAQTTTPKIERWHGGFRYIESKEKIDKETLADIFDPEAFASYSRAHNEQVASIPLWIVSGVGLSASAYYAIRGVNDCLNPPPVDQEHPVMPAAPFLFATSGVILVATLATLTPAIVLTIDSHNKLNRIASEYNHRGDRVYLEIGQINQGVGFTIKF